MLENNERPFLEVEDELNKALGNIGKDIKIHEQEDRIANYTVQELLEELKIDEFEKMYVTTAAFSNTPNMEKVPDEKLNDVKTMAEYRLSQMKQNENVDEKSREKLKASSNFYLIPRVAEQKISVGNQEKTQTVNLYTVNDVEGYCLYTVIGENNVTISKNFRDAIEKYLKENYPAEVASGELKINDVVEHFTPHNMNELYDKVEEEHSITMRFLSERVDEYARSKGIEEKDYGVKEGKLLDRQENLLEENKIKPKENIEEKTNENKEKTQEDEGIRNDIPIEIDEKEKEKEKEPEKKSESYIEKIARMNHVNPSVVNTRVVENFEKIEEDTGIHLQGRYRRGDVVAVRLPYKLQYRTFLVDKNTGMTIDEHGDMDRRAGRLYDFDEIEEYFRFAYRSGPDGGDDGRPLRYDEGKDYMTYIDEHGEVKEEKFVNNGKEIDMMKDDRERYLTEVGEADKRLEEAIEEYQKNATHENYQKVKEIIQEKVDIDNKYNALGKQREITEKTKENTEKVIEKDLDDDDWFPSHDER